MGRYYRDRIDVTPDDTVLTAGCNMAFVTVIMAIANSGDQVMLPLVRNLSPSSVHEFFVTQVLRSQVGVVRQSVMLCRLVTPE